jgi:tetratricopeptide (TPR) repeat protein
MNTTVTVIVAIVALVLVLVACSRRKSEVPATNPTDRHNQLFKEGSDLISPYMPLHGVEPKDASTGIAQREIKTGIDKLKQVVVLNPQNWAAYWVMGKAYQALGDSQNACESFKASWDIHKANADVAREYMFECLNLGRGAEGVTLAEQALTLEPNEPGLIANYALALLIDGKVDAAEKEVQRALQLDGTDKVTKDLQKIIGEVKSGKRPCPTKFGDLKGVK